MNVIQDLMASKKFWLTLIGLLCLTAIEIFTTKLPIDLFCGLFSALVGTYTIAQGISDRGLYSQPPDVDEVKK